MVFKLSGLLTSQLSWGSSLILEPLAPPLLSLDLKTLADAQAVEMKSLIPIFEFKIEVLRSLISLSFISL